MVSEHAAVVTLTTAYTSGMEKRETTLWSNTPGHRKRDPY